MGGLIVERKDEIRDLSILVDPRFSFGVQSEWIITKVQSLDYIKMISNLMQGR